MATYNGEKYIGPQIDSILQQTYPPACLIIRDNSSDDNSHAVVMERQKKFPNSITWIPSTTNTGVIGNFSALIDLSKADYVMFADSDDVWLPEKIQKTLRKMQEIEQSYGKETPLLVHTDLKVVNEGLELIHPSFWKYSYLMPQIPSTLARQLNQNQVTGCTLMANRALIGLARPLPEKIVMHDWWLALCASAFGKIDNLNEATVLYRQHDKNYMGAKKYGLVSYLKRISQPETRRRMVQNRLRVVEQAKQFLENYSSLLNNNQKETLDAFTKFDQSLFFHKAYLMRKYGFYKVGIIRNLWQVFGFSNFKYLFNPR